MELEKKNYKKWSDYRLDCNIENYLLRIYKIFFKIYLKSFLDLIGYAISIVLLKKVAKIVFFSLDTLKMKE